MRRVSEVSGVFEGTDNVTGGKICEKCVEETVATEEQFLLTSASAAVGEGGLR